VEGHPPEELLGPLNEVERKNAPKLLYYAGRRQLLVAKPRVSIIGARKASELGLRRAAKVARELVKKGITVVSGLAEGIDTAAHRATIEAGGDTIAVIGGALDAKPFPAQNAELQRKLMREHLVISEFPPGTATRPANFVARNRTMALVTNASVIIEASGSSGTRHQGWETLRLGRPLFLTRAVVEQDIEWPKEMLHYGAVVLEDPSEVADAVPYEEVPLVADLPF
jgi:DNA processing protein